MLQFNDFFNANTLNIFTDASMNSHNTIACAGCMCVYGEVDKKLPYLHTDFKSQIWKNVTNNIGEAIAVQMGIFEALEHRNFPIIRVISDSQITIFGIRDRIFNWKESKKHPGKLVGTSDVIKNQEYFLEMLYVMLEANVPIQFVHQQGHVTFTDKSLADAEHVFVASNGIRDNVDKDLIKAISMFNNYVDRTTRKQLYETDLYMCNNIDPIRYQYMGFDKDRFYKLTHTHQFGDNRGGIPT